MNSLPLLLSLLLLLQVYSLNVNGCVLSFAPMPVRRMRKHHKASQCLYQFLNKPGAVDQKCLQLNMKLGKSPKGLDLALGNKVAMHISKMPLDRLVLDEEQKELVQENGFSFQALGVLVDNCEKDSLDDQDEYQVVAAKASFMGLSVRRRFKRHF